MRQEDKIQKFTFGNAVFLNLSEENKEKIKNNEEIKSKLQRNQWWINNGMYQKYNWQEFFAYIIECKAQKIYLYENNLSQIISQMQNVRYVNLKILSLYGNKINNIQPLSFIYFKCLQQLCLDQNRISQIKCINKLSAPFLDNIRICKYQNPLHQINVLIRSKINSEKLKNLNLQQTNIFNSYQNQDTIHQDLSIAVKLNSNQIKLLYINQNKRIKQNKILSMLKLRFPQLQIRD